jgi:outer membrane protein
MRRQCLSTLIVVSGMVAPTIVRGQASLTQAAPAPNLTLDQAIQYAIDHYPTVRAALEQVNASSAGVSVARSAYLPRLDSLWQANRATANNIFGQLLPQPVIPAMSGPVLADTSGRSIWGSAAAVLVSWEPVDFGLRHAGVVAAEAALTRARAGETLTRLDVQSAVAMAFLAVVSAERTVAMMQADVDRRDVLRRSVQTLVDNQLRPGADASRVDAERAAAETRLIQAQQTLQLARTTLDRVLGITATPVTISDDRFLTQSPVGGTTSVDPATHPLAQVHQAAVEQARAAEESLARTDFPHVLLQSSLFARGSGARTNGMFVGGPDGLGLDRANWAAGVQVMFPNVFDFSSLHARKAAATATERAEVASYDEALLAIRSQQRTATTLLESARAIAANTPIQLAAARQSESQARARYDAGLASITEVADAQSLLAQAEVQDQLARIDVWRALLASAVAQGDLTPFVSLLRQP